MILHLDDKRYSLFIKMFNQLINEKESYDWRKVFERLLEPMASGRFNDLLVNIQESQLEDKDFRDKLLYSFELPSKYPVREIADIERIQETIANYPDFDKLSEEEQINLLCLKAFGISSNDARSLCYRFCEITDRIQDKNLRDFICAISEIAIDSGDTKINISELYKEITPMEHDNILVIEQRLKNECARLYNNELFRVTEKLPQNEKGYYMAGTQFKMLVNVKAGANKEDPIFFENFQDDWNRPISHSPVICGSLISEEMLGLIKERGLIYGFNEINDGELDKMSDYDLCTSFTGFTSVSKGMARYLDPQTLIDKTDDYNEIDINRGKKTPDYIVALMVDGEIINEAEIEKARNDWEGKLPVVVINVNECIAEQERQVTEMIQNWNINPTQEEAQEIYRKIRNNRQSSFGRKIFTQDMEKEWSDRKKQRYFKETTKQSQVVDVERIGN